MYGVEAADFLWLNRSGMSENPLANPYEVDPAQGVGRGSQSLRPHMQNGPGYLDSGQRA